MGPAASSTLVQIHRWLASIHGDGSGRSAVRRVRRSRSDVIEDVAEDLIDATGVERKLLSKSIQETLFYCVGFEAIDYSRFKTQLIRYVDRQGESSFMQRFLSLYFFNFVWFHTGESFRNLARTTDSFLKDMEFVERVCKKAVASKWKSFEQAHRHLDSTAAKELVRNIEQHLRGNQNGS